MEHLIVPTFVVDRDGVVLVWNKACERLTGVAAQEVIGTRDHWKAFYTAWRPCLCDLVVAGRYSEIGSFFEYWTGGGLTDYGVSLEAQCEMPRRERGLHLSVDAGPIYDDSGALVAVVETLRDITAAKEAQSALEDLATHDGLTGLWNRRGFDHALASAVRCAVSEGSPLSLLMLDIDYFKRYNDHLGHVGGDLCLQAVAKTIAGALRAHDTAARYGGEEFAVILFKTDEDGARSAAERLRDAIRTLGVPHPNSPVSSSVTLSIGGVTGRSDALTPNDLVTSADAALYASKREGRDKISFSHVRSSDLVLF